MKQYFSLIYKSLALIVFFSLIAYHGISQQVGLKELAGKIDRAVNRITEASYVFHDSAEKINVGEDTTHKNIQYKNYFRKFAGDTLIGYKLASIHEDGFKEVYDGNSLIVFFPTDSSLEITDKAIAPEKIAYNKSSCNFYPFFVNLNSAIQYKAKEKYLHQKNLIEIVPFNGEQCYKINMIYGPLKGKDGKLIKMDYYTYVSTKSFLPVRYYLHFEKIVGKVTEINTFDYWVTNLKIGKIDDAIFTKESIGSDYKKIIYSKASDADTSQLLPIGTVSPDWELPLITGGKIKLSDLKGKIVVLDFWFKSCPPCQQQMLLLESLNGKYDKDKVVFIGINTSDDLVKDKLELFIENRNVKMLSAYNGKTIETLYGINAEPFLMIIDREGKIIFQKAGYSDSLKDDIAKTIKEH